MSAATKLRGKFWRRGVRFSVDTCERAIIENWSDLCRETHRDDGSVGSRIYQGVLRTRLHDYGVFRQRAMKRESRE